MALRDMATLTLEDVLTRLRPEFEKRSAPYSYKPSALLALLHAVQEAYGHIPPESEGAVAAFLGIGANQVHEAVTFYTLYRQRPLGTHHLQICRTLSCDLCGAADLAAVARKRLGVGPREVTPDGLFSWETVECLGCCEKAPVVQENLEPFKGPLTAESFGTLIDELAAKSRSNGK